MSKVCIYFNFLFVTTYSLYIITKPLPSEFSVSNLEARHQFYLSIFFMLPETGLRESSCTNQPIHSTVKCLRLEIFLTVVTVGRTKESRAYYGGVPLELTLTISRVG